MEENTFEIRYKGRPRRMMETLGMVYDGALCLSISWEEIQNETVETWKSGDWDGTIYPPERSYLQFNPYNQ